MGVKFRVKMRVKSNLSIRDFLKMGGKYRDLRLVLSNARKFTSNTDQLHLLERYHYLLVNTEYLRDEVYDFFIHEIGYKQLEEEYHINPNYIRNIIYKEVTRLFEDISEDPFALVRYKDYEIDQDEKDHLVDIMIQRIDRLIKTQGIRRTDDLLDYMVLDLRNYAEDYKEEDGEIDLNLHEDTIKRLQYLSKPYLELLFNRSNKRNLGYIIHLLTTSERKLSERDKIKKQELCDLWFIPTE